MGMKMPTKVTIPIRNDYIPKLEGKNEIEQSELTIYKELIGELR